MVDQNQNQNDDANKGGGDDKAAVNFFSTAPETWRNDLVSLAGIKDEKEIESRMNQLGRITDVGSLVKSFFNAQDKIRKGEISSGLPENATPEQIAAYRAANDIPEAPDKYKLALEEGLELGEHNKGRINKILEQAHSGMISNKVASGLVNTILKEEAEYAKQREAQDGLDTQQSENLLRQTWGSDYQANVNMVKGLVNKLPAEVQEVFFDARMPDGKALLNDASIFMWLADIAREVNPIGFVAPNSNNPHQTVNDEIAALEKRMGTKEWFSDEAAQKRYQQLITARENMKK